MAARWLTQILEELSRASLPQADRQWVIRLQQTRGRLVLQPQRQRLQTLWGLHVGARRPAQEVLARLTQQQRQVLHYLCAGLSNKMVAARMGLAVSTVETHRAAVYRWLGVDGLVPMVRRLVRWPTCPCCGAAVERAAFLAERPGWSTELDQHETFRVVETTHECEATDGTGAATG